MEWVFDLQRSINIAVVDLIGSIAETRDWTALAGVLVLGVVFGAIHALTPGHSKLVLTSYLVGSRLAWARGVAVAGALATTHISSAVVLALAAAPLITRTISGAGRAPALELVSRGMLAAIGLWLMVRAIRGRSHGHREGVLVGVVAGIIPCPLTLFAMFLALSKGVLAAGLTFALAMMVGVTITLAGVATLSVFARDRALTALTRHGTSIERLSRWLDLVSGGLLLLIGVVAVLSQ